jgi:hypothetical protein
MKRWDNSGYEPTAWQLAFTGTAAAWLVSLFIEKVWLGRNGGLNALGQFLSALIHWDWRAMLPFVWWGICPLIVMALILKSIKKFRLVILLLATLALLVALLVGDPTRLPF